MKSTILFYILQDTTRDYKTQEQTKETIEETKEARETKETRRD